MTTYTNQSKTLGTGTGTVSTTAAAVVGVSTLFTTQLAVGQVIIISSQSRVISAIADNTHLTLDRGLTSNVSGQAFQYEPKWSNQAVS